MDKITYEELPELFESVAAIFAEKKDELCDMDAHMGDGDLGLTMNKGFGALPGLIKENGVEGDIGKTLMKSGMKMASLVPSTMGTLMSSGLMGAGKAMGSVPELGAKELSVFFRGFADGVANRGKNKPGERTITDALEPAALSAEEAFAGGGDLKAVIDGALSGVEKGVEATKDMLPVKGKAAVFADRAKGVPDQGAVAAKYLIQGMHNYISE
ncbi:MAG: dihydroxyacetone kinase subunit L [Lachnospiraceae bacterium]|nr:dihydroxyacetone kinase subunit L [Lachnospiraceae bacterium]